MRKQQFLNYVESVFEKSGKNATRFGELVANDPSFLTRLRCGRECREKTQEKIKARIGYLSKKGWQKV